MSKKIFSVKFVVLCLVAVIIGGLWAANAAGFIQLKDYAKKIPLVSTFFKDPVPEENNIPTISPVEQENQDLRSQIKTLEERILALEGEKVKYLEQISQMQQETSALNSYKADTEKFIDNSKQLAEYYKKMKPEAAVSIMNNLDDSTVLAILLLLDKEQASKILSLMDPQRAALLSQNILGETSSFE